MNNIRRVAGNLSSLLSGEVVSSALAFVITILLARRLSDEGFGRLAFVQSIMVYFTLTMDMGLATFGAREIARQPDKLAMYVGNIFSLRLLIALVISVPFAIAVALLPIQMEMRWLCWASTIGLFTQALNPEFAFQGSERMNGIAAWRVLVHTFYLILIFVIIIGRAQLWAVPLLRFAAEAMTILLLGVLLLRNRERLPMFTWQPAIWRGYLRESLVMAASVVVIKLYYTFDTIMLGIMDKPEAVGWYQAAYKVVLLFIGIAGLIQIAFAPLFSRFWRDRMKLEEITLRFGILLLFVSSLIAGILIIFHHCIINITFGLAYAQAGIGLELLAWSMLFVFFDTIFMAPLLYINRQNYYLIIVCVGAAVNILLNLIMIPRYSFIGAAVATIFSNALIFILAVGAFYKAVNQARAIKHILIWIIILLICFILLSFIGPNKLLWSCVLLFVFATTFLVFHRHQFLAIKDSLD